MLMTLGSVPWRRLCSPPGLSNRGRRVELLPLGQSGSGAEDMRPSIADGRRGSVGEVQWLSGANPLKSLA